MCYNYLISTLLSKTCRKPTSEHLLFVKSYDVRYDKPVLKYILLNTVLISVRTYHFSLCVH